jgi:Chemotaxis signal transduction protein
MGNSTSNAELMIEDALQGRFLSFSFSKETFAIEIKYVTEIVGIQPITPVPEVPDYVMGIINLRGKIIPVIDMRIKFRKPAADYNDRTCIIVVDLEETSVGFIVDNVEEVLSIPDEKIVPPPDYKTGIQNRYIKGIGIVEDKVMLLLDCAKLLSGDEMERISLL